MGYARPSIWKNLLAEQMKQQSVIMALSLVLWYMTMTMAAQELPTAAVPFVEKKKNETRKHTSIIVSA